MNFNFINGAVLLIGLGLIGYSQLEDIGNKLRKSEKSQVRKQIVSNS